MTFDEVLDRVLEMLRRRGRVSYRALKRQFDLDDAFLEELKAEIVDVYRSPWGAVTSSGIGPSRTRFQSVH